MVDRPRILVADDNPVMLGTVARLLQHEFQVVAIQQPREVVTSVQEFKPAVVVLDISMGQMTGFEVANLLKANGCDSKIIFLTIHQEQQFIETAFDVGASGYVFKSRLRDLVAAINIVRSGKIFISEPKIRSRSH